jgi:hypothetical protein
MRESIGNKTKRAERGGRWGWDTWPLSFLRDNHRKNVCVRVLYEYVGVCVCMCMGRNVW